VFAGCELFTGHTMTMTIGLIYKKTNIADLLVVWCTSWLFNLIGSVALAYLYIVGGGALLADAAPLLNQVASYKMNSPAVELVARAILCNWLVCLAIWMAARCSSDSGKAIVIFWCLFAFISSGYEHSVANMTLLSIALLGEHPETVSLAGMSHNLLWVTIGNIIGGALFMGGGYWLASGSFSECVASEQSLKKNR
jgi:nitrite transporter NirC